MAADPASRIVSVGGSVTEIVFALGEDHRLVARDTTSNHPPAALELPNVGYRGRLSPENILAVNPDLIISEEGAGPHEVIELLNEAALPMVTIPPHGYDVAAVQAKITAVAEALEVREKGADLAAEVGGADLQAAMAEAGDVPPRKVLFVLSTQGGRIMAAGKNTAADGIISLAGGVNVMGDFEGYKPVTDEAISTSGGVEVILMMDRAGINPGTDEELLAMPALTATPVAQTRAVVRIDGMLLTGFSVRTPEAVRTLAQACARRGGDRWRLWRDSRWVKAAWAASQATVTTGAGAEPCSAGASGRCVVAVHDGWRVGGDFVGTCTGQPLYRGGGAGVARQGRAV